MKILSIDKNALLVVKKTIEKFRQSIKPPKDLTDPLQYIEDALESKRKI